MPDPANDPGQPRLQVSDADLAGYVAGTLDSDRRRSVEGFLACNPDLAAGVMTQMHLSRPRSAGRPKRGVVALALAVGVAACVGSGVGWTASERRNFDGWRELDGGDPPAYVEDAAESRQASSLREVMVSQLETPSLDAREIRERLSLTLPTLPANWRVKDVQVFPTDHGPSVNVVVETHDRRRLQLFAVRAASMVAARPEVAVRGRESVAFWERNGAAYVLSGPQSNAELLADASALAAGAKL
ncbi:MULTISPECIES: hypothetical protein [unclassified Phenylobacterium]|uniref:hypothetical protein n=1 Tax=unclassified Phenylobacterium TaxID=2640670 RepID=UPI00083AF769|nr:MULTISPECIES: hypothetical protein [unclassified Phenylobacterium]